MSDQRSEEYLKVQDSLEKIKKNLVDISALDLSKIHIDQEWSWVPYVKDHLDFLVEQVSGLLENLRDSKPPTTPEEIEKIKAEMQSQNEK